MHIDENDVQYCSEEVGIEISPSIFTYVNLDIDDILEGNVPVILFELILNDCRFVIAEILEGIVPMTLFEAVISDCTCTSTLKDDRISDAIDEATKFIVGAA